MLLNVKVQQDSAGYQQQNAVYIVTLNWEGDADLDLWGQDPQGRLVSFNRREGGEGSLFSLNRDCLGAQTTEMGPDGEIISKINEEIISIRGLIPGEYTFNLHAYNMKDSKPVKATVKLIKNKPYRLVIEKTKEISTSGQEETYFRFSTDKDGNAVNINELPTSLINGK